MGESCKACRYWARVERECRRWPPVHPGREFVRAVWPVTHPDDWCGEFSRGDN